MPALTPIALRKIIQSRTYTTLVLGSNEKSFAIYTEPSVGKTIQSILGKQESQRPSSHDLMASLFRGFEIRPIQVVFEDLKESIFFAKLFAEKVSLNGRIILEVDSRPSDCLILSVLYNLPIFCREELLTKAPNFEG